MTRTQTPVALARFDRASLADATAILEPCCASRRWVTELAGGRPYGSYAALERAADAALSALTWADVLEALSAHPRIGDRMASNSTEAAWSRSEQSGTIGMSDETASDLLAANLAYERRFEHVFLICATGLSPEQMLAAARARLANEPDVEAQVVRAELAKIVALRLAKAVAP